MVGPYRVTRDRPRPLRSVRLNHKRRYELRKDYMRKTILVLLASIGGVAGQVVPFVECVSFDPATNLLVATWGYTNSSSSAVIFPFGAKNFFSPPPSVQGQPATFQPGMHHRLFQTVIDLTVDSS